MAEAKEKTAPVSINVREKNAQRLTEARKIGQNWVLGVLSGRGRFIPLGHFFEVRDAAILLNAAKRDPDIQIAAATAALMIGAAATVVVLDMSGRFDVIENDDPDASDAITITTEVLTRGAPKEESDEHAN